MKNQIKPGAMSAMLTPFSEDGSVKESAIAEIVDFQIERGLHGLYIGGSTGEGMMMCAEQRMQVAEATVKAARGRTQVIIHVGCTDTDTAVQLAKHAKQIGANGLSSIPPYYYRHHKDYIKSYYRDVAAATDLPFLVYHVPSQTVGLTYETLTELMQLPNVVGMKYTEDNLEVLCKFRQNEGKDCLAFIGHDAMLLAALTEGATGGIGAFYNVMPQGFADLYDAFTEGRLADALAEQHRINFFITMMKKYMLSGNQVPLKAVMKAYGVDCGIPKRPVPPISAEAEAALLKELKDHSYFDIYR